MLRFSKIEMLGGVYCEFSGDHAWIVRLAYITHVLPHLATRISFARVRVDAPRYLATFVQKLEYLAASIMPVTLGWISKVRGAKFRLVENMFSTLSSGLRGCVNSEGSHMRASLVQVNTCLFRPSVICT
jgi:hypothetical protein